jgi:hypothetical protein
MRGAIFICLILSGCASKESEKSHSCEIKCDVCEGLLVTCRVFVDKVLVEVTGA